MSHWKGNAFGVLIVSILCRVVSSGTIFLRHDSYDETLSIAKCLLAVVNGDAYRRSTVIIINGEYINDNVNTEDAYAPTLTQILARAYTPQIVIKNWHYLSEMIKNYEDNLLIVVIINSCDFLIRMNEIIYDSHKYLIIINDNLKQKCNHDLIKIGYALQHQDATFIVRDTYNYGYKLLTTIPEINSDTCQYDKKVSITPVNSCTNGKLKHIVVFPNKKLKNFKQCEFKVGMATMYPYAMANNKNSLRNLQQLSESEIRGSDVEIIKIISNYYNASLKLYYIHRLEENPYLDQEFVSFLINGTLDACAGGLYRIYEDFVYYSGIYSSQTITWVYVVEREPKSWQTVVTKGNGLYIFILFYIGYSIVWILLCKFDYISVSCRNTFLYSWGALIGSSSIQEPWTRKQKILNISYLLLCLHLSAYISVKMYSFFTIQEPPPTFKTNEDVMASGRTLYLNNDTKYFVEDDKYKAFAKTSKDCANFYDCEQKMLLNKGITAMHEGYFHRLQAFTAVDNEAQVMRAGENILVVYHEMIVRKNSPFASKFEWIVQRLFEAGICNRLYILAVGLLIEDKAKNFNANIMANSYRCESGCAINMSQINGAIFVLLLGCIMSFIVFVIEISIFKMSTQS